MARTKQTARASTSGKAPRKQLFAKPWQQQYQSRGAGVYDFNGSDKDSDDGVKGQRG